MTSSYLQWREKQSKPAGTSSYADWHKGKTGEELPTARKYREANTITNNTPFEGPSYEELNTPLDDGAVAYRPKIELPKLDLSSYGQGSRDIAPGLAEEAYAHPQEESDKSTPLRDAFIRGGLQADLNIAYDKLRQDPNNESSQAEAKRLEEAYATAPQIGADAGWLDKAVLGFAQMLPMQAKALVHGVKIGAVTAAGGAAASSIMGGIGAIPGAGVGLTAGTASYMMKQGTGEAYRRYIQEGVDHDTAVKASLAAGAVNAAIEVLQLGQIAKTIPGIKSLVSEAGETVAKSIMRVALKDYPINVIEQAGEEGLQQLVTTAVGEVSKEFENRTKGKDLPVDAIKPFIEAKDEFLATIPTFAVGGFLPHLGQVGQIASQRLASPQVNAGATQANVVAETPAQQMAEQPQRMPAVAELGPQPAQTVEQEIGQRLGQLIDEYVLAPQTNAKGSDLAPAVSLREGDTSVYLPHISPVEVQRQSPVEVPQISAGRTMPTPQIQAPQIARFREAIPSPLIENPVSTEVAVTSDRSLLPEVEKKAKYPADIALPLTLEPRKGEKTQNLLPQLDKGIPKLVIPEVRGDNVNAKQLLEKTRVQQVDYEDYPDLPRVTDKMSSIMPNVVATKARAAELITQRIAQIEIASPGFNIDLQAFAQRQIKQYQQLLTEIERKGITAKHRRIIEHLVEHQDAVKVLKREFKAKLAAEVSSAKSQVRSTEQAKANARLERADRKAMYRRMFDKIETNERIAKLRSDAVERVKAVREQERTQGKARLERFKEQVRSKQEAQKAKVKDLNTRKRLLKTLRKLDGAKLRPHQQAAANQLLAHVDTAALSMRGATRVRLEKALEFFEAQKAADPSYEVDEALQAKLQRLSKKQIKDLTIEDVQTMQDAADHIIRSNETEKMMIDREKAVTIREAKQKALEEINAPDEIRKRGVVSKAVEPLSTLIDQLAMTGALSPDNQAARLAGWDYESTLHGYLYTRLNEGQRRSLEVRSTARQSFAEMTKGVNMKDWGKSENVSLSGGKVVELTPAEMIDIYMHSLNRDNVDHLIGEGFVKERNAEAIPLTRVDLRIIQQMVRSNPDMMTVIKALQEVRDEYLTKPNNEVSVEMYGYEKAKIRDYWRIKVASDHRDRNVAPFSQLASLENPKHLREREGGKNALMVRDYRETFDEMIDTTATFVGLAIPVRNAKVILGDAKITRAIGRKFGRSMTQYYETLLKQIQGNKHELEPLESVAQRTASGLTKSILSANPWIVTKQFGSLAKAFPYVDFTDIIKGSTHRVDWDTVYKYSPIIWDRAEGGVSREVRENKQSVWVKPIEWADKQVIGLIWNAAEAKVKAEKPSIKGAELYQEVARLTEKIIEDTQQSANAMQRSGISRSESPLIKGATVFTSEANASYNWLVKYSVLGAKDPRKNAAMLLGVLAAHLANSMFEASVNMFRHKFNKREGEFGDELLSSLMGPVYFANWLYSAFTKKFHQGNMLEAAVADAVWAIKGLASGKKNTTPAGLVKDAALVASQFWGTPINNIYRTFDAALAQAAPDASYEFRRTFHVNTDAELKSMLVEEYTRDSKSSMVSRLITDMKKAEITRGELSSYLKTKATEIKKENDKLRSEGKALKSDPYTPLVNTLPNRLPIKY